MGADHSGRLLNSGAAEPFQEPRPTPSLSVIILTRNSAQYIRGCVTSLFAAVTGILTEVILVDNGSTDPTLSVVRELQRDAPLGMFAVIPLDQNRGTTLSRNLGLERATGDYLLVLDADTQIVDGAVHTLLDVMRMRPRAGLVAPQLLSPQGTVQYSCRRFPTVTTKLLRSLPLLATRAALRRDELYAPTLYLGSDPVEVDYCISAAWLIRRRAMLDVGLLDERIFYAPEDVDYCLRMWFGGWRVVYAPNARVIHHEQRLSYGNLPLAISHLRGLLYFFHKHGYWLSRDTLYRRLQQADFGRSHQKV